ncbi:hypothetical protein M501DRAFT_598353 [Patellaria atrata CBS 101060]|uniref:CCHC-type domain-containing protein n=1 Tax=Patellaria atrata CBS 101060 TaxID=1346257 RepID=A0A9P4S345_9PEZI|nr:hypothetical protein M501DRAFT_598353 [Patellaria atrata CBS 101060]
MIHHGVILQLEVANLRRANEAATRRKKRQKKRLQLQGCLTKVEGAELIAQINVDEQIREETRQNRQRARGDAATQQRCRTCGNAGHNSRTCGRD